MENYRTSAHLLPIIHISLVVIFIKMPENYSTSNKTFELLSRMLVVAA